MEQVEPNSTRRKGLWATLAIATVTSASAVTIALPAISNADPEVPTPVPPATTTPPLAAGPAAPATAAPPAQVDPNASSPPVDPNAGRIANAVGGFSYVLPPGWVESDASHLDYGSALLSKTTGPPPLPDQPPPVANDTRIVMGRLDQKLYASAEANDAKAAVRLGSDMGEFFLPYPGTRINQESTPLTGANGVTGSASYYEVKFSDASKPNGQIWTDVVGLPAASTPSGGPPQRWFVVWLGTANDPVDKGAAKALAESIQPWAGPAAPAAGAQSAPGTPAPAPAPAAPPAPAPAGEVSPTPTPAPQRTQST